MNCIITLRIKDYFPKIETIPYENFICLFTYEDFFGKIPLIEKSNNICKHEIQTISSDIKYNIHILEYNESSLIGICEIVIPFIKIRRIKAPGKMVQEQKIKLIIDVNTKRKLFGKLINSGDIYLVLCAEVFIPDKNNIIIMNDINNKININPIKLNNNKKIKVRISNKKNLDGTPRTIKKKRMMMEMKSNREMIKNDNSIDNINKNFNNTNNRNNTINYDLNYDEKNNTGIIRNKIKLEKNQVNVIDFRNKNDNLYNKNNDMNLTTKEIKKLKITKKRSPKKKITILELLEQKMQPLISNTNINGNEIMNIRSNTYYNNGSNIKNNTEKYNKSGRRMLDIKRNNNNDNKLLNINNTVKRIDKEENKINSNKLVNSVLNSPNVIAISPSHNINSPNALGDNKIKRNKSKGINKINKKYKNNYNLYNGKSLNETEINKNNYNTVLTKKIRNSSQEVINRNSYKEKDNNLKDSIKLAYNKRPKIDISLEMLQRKSVNNNKLIKDLIKKNNNSYSTSNNYDMNSNNALLSTEERTEQGLSEIDKIILEKGTELRDLFQNQIKNNNYTNINAELNNSNKNKNEKININNLKNQKNLNNLYYDMATPSHQLIGGANYTIETPKTNQDLENFNNILDNKSSFCSSSQSLSFLFNQEDLKNNYIGLIDLYYLLNKKLSKTVFENSDLYKKLKIYKENYNNEIKKEEIIKDKNDRYRFNSYININIKQSINNKVLEHLAYIKNLESKLYQDIFGYTYDDYEIIRTNEIERVNKLKEERKLKILLKIIKSIINDCGNVSQIFFNNKNKEKILKNILSKYNIKEKEEGDENSINLKAININYKYGHKFNKYNNLINGDDIFENKIIREVDEDKEEEESVYSASNKKKNNYHFYFNNEANESKKNEPIKQNQTTKINPTNEENEINIKEKENFDIKENDDKKEKNQNSESPKINNDVIDEENKNIDIMKQILIEEFNKKYGKNKIFNHINKNEFIFDDKYKVLANLNDNKEIIIEVENNKYNLNEFVSVYCKDENNIENSETNKKEKFIYRKKRGQLQNKKENEDNEYQKKRRKRRIDDESGEEKDNSLTEKEQSNSTNKERIIKE